eukprot:3409209-Amphidinium_carterae.1
MVLCGPERTSQHVFSSFWIEKTMLVCADLRILSTSKGGTNKDWSYEALGIKYVRTINSNVACWHMLVKSCPTVAPRLEPIGEQQGLAARVDDGSAEGSGTGHFSPRCRSWLLKMFKVEAAQFCHEAHAVVDHLEAEKTRATVNQCRARAAHGTDGAPSAGGGRRRKDCG